ncbi:MAG TPA: hypothetical protein VGO58_07275 [Chitinophagaceae bacterium]|jgi:hypothetical protein|nr:hypothetical protein [Chitinophagaceae bacterium]
MKKVFTLTLLLIAFNSFSQDTEKLEQYCKLVVTGRMLSSKVVISVDYGEERSLWKDNRLKNDDGKLVKFNSEIDALNYLGKQGWKLVNAYPVATTSNSVPIYHYVFRKEFPRSEVE